MNKIEANDEAPSAQQNGVKCIATENYATIFMNVPDSLNLNPLSSPYIYI